jgi:hypothetical protein
MKLNQEIQEYISRHYTIQNDKGLSLVIFREDGLVLYQSESQDSKTTASLGALMGGSWQAATAMLNINNQGQDDINEFRMSFDSSSSGIYILPIGEVDKHKLYLGTLYHSQVNPAQLKNRLRTFKQGLETFTEKINVRRKKENTSDSGKFLFNNISDSEMDNLFSGMES